MIDFHWEDQYSIVILASCEELPPSSHQFGVVHAGICSTLISNESLKDASE